MSSGLGIVNSINNNIANIPNMNLTAEQQQQLFDANIGALNSYSSGQTANAWMSGIGTAFNAGMNIWGAIENSKNNAANRQLMAKQMQLAQEQINASQQARKERASELARLNRIRSNTNTQYNTAAQVSRSY